MPGSCSFDPDPRRRPRLGRLVLYHGITTDIISIPFCTLNKSNLANLGNLGKGTYGGEDRGRGVTLIG